MGFEELYVKNARIYQPVLEAGLAIAPSEAKGLARIFRKRGVSGSSKILDVCCGIGRHSVELAKLGYEVVGFDFSAYFLKTAERLAKRNNLSKHQLRFYHGDTKYLRKILTDRGEGSFDAIICMDGGFHRPTRQEERSLFVQMQKLGAKNCILGLDMYSTEFSESSFFRYYNRATLIQVFPKAELERHILMNYDRASRILSSHWRFYRKGKNDNLKHLVSIDFKNRLYTQRGLETMLRETGWNPKNAYASFASLRKFTPKSPNLSIVAIRQ